MTSRISISEQVAQALARGAIVLTSNQRAARLLQRLDTEGDRLLPWSAWTAQMWQRLLLKGREHRVILRQSHELLLWKRVLSEQDRELGTSTLANLAASASDLVGKYKLRAQLHASQSHRDVRIFLRAFAAMEKLCAEHRWLLASFVEEALAKHLETEASLPTELLLVGFDSMVPAQEDIVQVLKNHGTKVSHAVPSYSDAERQLAACTDTTEEIEQCAAWAAQLLQKNAAARIAIVTPSPDEIRHTLERALRQHLSPAMKHIATSQEDAMYEFSLGRPLALPTMTRHALLLLRWLHGPILFEQASELLRSPYFDSPETLLLRAEFDVHGLRKESHLTSEIAFERALDLLPSGSLQDSLRSTKALFEQQKQSRPWQQWAETFATLLAQSGWPGSRALSSIEFQLQQRWAELLDELAMLQLIGEEVTYATALSTLEELAATMLFAPQSHDAPVQVLGPLEAAGGEFDALWFLGVDETQWPASSTSNPLLPFTLQRDAQLPGASTDAAFHIAAAMTQRILQSAPVVVVSYSQHSPEGEVLRPSSILRELPFKKFEPIPLPQSTPVLLHKVEDKEALPPLLTKHLHGGASVLELQAACPFRAFAERRLYATQPDDVDDGLNPIQRGNHVHNVLSNFWNEVRTQQSLRTMPRADRDALLRRLIRRELAPAGRAAWESAYLEIEEERFFHLLNRWLEKELERTPFEVEHTELKVEDAVVGPLHMDLRIDRVDIVETSEGRGRLLIDYKTGADYKSAKWEGDRPDAPQLPLYAVAGRMEDVCGIAFATIRTGKDAMGLQGLSTPTEIVQHTKNAPAFDEALLSWNDVLRSLAEQFAEGTATVGPKNYPVTCTHCEQRILCRITTSNFEEEDDAEASE